MGDGARVLISGGARREEGAYANFTNKWHGKPRDEVDDTLYFIC